MIVETTHKLISAAALSRILKNAGIKKANATGWSTGFTVTGYGPVVEIHYQVTDREVEKATLKEIADTINGRKDRKYFAKITKNEYDMNLVRVIARVEDDPEQAETPKVD